MIAPDSSVTIAAAAPWHEAHAAAVAALAGADVSLIGHVAFETTAAMSRALVTGATGFVGGRLASALACGLGGARHGA